jgi:hypothetical protein
MTPVNATIAQIEKIFFISSPEWLLATVSQIQREKVKMGTNSLLRRLTAHCWERGRPLPQRDEARSHDGLSINFY